MKPHSTAFPLLLAMVATVAPLLRVAAQEIPADGPDLIRTGTGLRYSVLAAGSGDARPRPGDVVRFHYSAWLPDGRMVESTGQNPRRLTLGVGMPKAWTEVMQLMRPGAKFKVHAPADLMYGKVGSRGKPPEVPGVPPDSPLLFTIDLLSFEEGIGLPRYRLPNLAKQKRTASGLKIEVLEPGRGPRPTTGERCTVEFSLFNERGQLVATSLTPEDAHIVARIGGDFDGPPFLPEAIGMLRLGARIRIDVPPRLAFGAAGKGYLVPPGSTTTWVLALLKLDPAPEPRPVPKFAHLLRHGVDRTASGLRYEFAERGKGRKPTAEDTVELHYAGWTSNGKLFFETFSKGIPAEVDLGRKYVVRGLQEAILLMPVGSTLRCIVPPNLAYGLRGDKELGIGPNRRLYFYVELVAIEGDER